MYIIKIYDKSKNALTRIEKFSSLKIDNALNKECKANFVVPNIPEYSKTILKKKNVIEIYRLWIKIFEWVIIWVNPWLTSISIDLESYSHILKYRFLYTSYSWTIESVITSIFSAALSDWPIPVTLSTSLTWDISLDLTNKNLKSAIESIKTAWKEYYYWSDILYIWDAIWDDKTNIVLKFLENRVFENNIKNVSVKEDWVEIINSVTWYKTWLSWSPVTIEDATSISEYWKYKDVVNFSEANDLSTLNNLIQWYLDENKNEVVSIDFNLLQTKINSDLLNIWDTVSVIIEKWYINFNLPLRILWKSYNVNKWSTLSEEIWFTLSEWTKDVKDFFETIANMKNRISTLEKK